MGTKSYSAFHYIALYIYIYIFLYQESFVPLPFSYTRKNNMYDVFGTNEALEHVYSNEAFELQRFFFQIGFQFLDQRIDLHVIFTITFTLYRIYCKTIVS